MVYQLADKLARSLQSKCLLCCKSLKNQENKHFCLCHHCQLKLKLEQTRCPRCALALAHASAECGQCLQAPAVFDTASAATSYNQHSKALIHSIKLCDNATIRLGADLMLQHSPPAIDLIITAPMHQTSWLKRGNNHSYLLAKKLSQQIGIALLSKELLQIKATEPQKQLSFKARKRNVKGAFTFTGNRDVIAGKRIAVVDDILTSMATLNEISRELKANDAATVHAWVLARTEKQAFNRSINR